MLLKKSGNFPWLLAALTEVSHWFYSFQSPIRWLYSQTTKEPNNEQWKSVLSYLESRIAFVVTLHVLTVLSSACVSLC